MPDLTWSFDPPDVPGLWLRGNLNVVSKIRIVRGGSYRGLAAGMWFVSPATGDLRPVTALPAGLSWLGPIPNPPDPPKGA